MANVTCDARCRWREGPGHVGTCLISMRAADTVHRDCYDAVTDLCERYGSSVLLLCLGEVLRDRAEATGSQRYELAAEDVRKAYDRRAGGPDDPEKGRAR